MAKAIHSISIPNPFFEGRNSVYVLREDPLTLIDTGAATDKAYASLVSGLAELGLVVGDLKRIILTHKHIDHIGNAWRIQQESDAEVLIHHSECKSVTNVDPSGKRFSQLVRERMTSWGAPPEQTPDDKNTPMPTWILESCRVTGLRDGQELAMENDVMEVIHTPGHTSGSICLRWGEQLFSGDHVLNEMSPNVGAGDMRSRGLLRNYLQSLEKVCELGIETTHPGHGPSFRSLVERCHELLAHHQDRLAAIESILRLRGATVYDVALALFGDMSEFHLLLGCAEANSHLEYLEDRGSVVQDDGLYRTNA